MRQILISILIVLSFACAAQAQQGTVILRDSNTNTQASVKTAGTVTPNVVGVQGNASGVPIPVTLPTGGITVSPSICSGATCYTSPVNAGATVISSGSTSTLFAATTGIIDGHCNNVTNAAVTLTMTDGNNVAFVGTTTNGASFSIPAVSSFSFPPGLIGSIMTSGIRASASAANAITCWVRGLQ